MSEVTFQALKGFMEEKYAVLKEECRGKVASYIPELAKVDPNLFAIGLHTVQNETFSIGDCEIEFCLQSCSKPVLYCLAQKTRGVDTVHRYVGHEPSGRAFNAFALTTDHKPHNPLINAGSILCCSLISPELEAAARYNKVLDHFLRTSGEAKSKRVGFDTGTFLSEKNHADRNYALSYFMKEHGCFENDVDLQATLDLYFQSCSITMDIHALSAMAATLANGGVCPVTYDKVFEPDVVKNCLSLMFTCGMYDYSGRFAFEVGIPAKSGVSGVLMLVIPGVCGMAVFSPRIDETGNTMRGLAFSRALVRRFPSVHIFHKISMGSDELLETLEKACKERLLISSANCDDSDTVGTLLNDQEGIDADSVDGDGRSALYHAVKQGNVEITKMLLEKGAKVLIGDKFGSNTLSLAYSLKDVSECHRQCYQTILARYPELEATHEGPEEGGVA